MCVSVCWLGVELGGKLFLTLNKIILKKSNLSGGREEGGERDREATVPIRPPPANNRRFLLLHYFPNDLVVGHGGLCLLVALLECDFIQNIPPSPGLEHQYSQE